VPLKRAPATATLFSTMAEQTKATSTPRMVTVCAAAAADRLPKEVPATTGARQRGQRHSQQG
jgi:hypothetical protein